MLEVAEYILLKYKGYNAEMRIRKLLIILIVFYCQHSILEVT